MTNVLVCLAESAGIALCGVITTFRYLKDCGYKSNVHRVFTRLFETGVLSILSTTTEILGYGNYSKCDHIINIAMRYFIGVHRFARLLLWWVPGWVIWDGFIKI